MHLNITMNTAIKTLERKYEELNFLNSIFTEAIFSV